MLRSFCSVLSQALILVRAREVTTQRSQSRFGVWVGEVRISTVSPLRSS